jgi:hypothetical protein
MATIILKSRSGPDRKLHLEVPVDQADTEFEVEVVVREKPAVGQGWPPGYDALFGAIDDDTFMIHPQPPIQHL